MSETSGGVASVPEPWWRRSLKENPGLFLTLSYLFLTGVGAFYNWRLCARFGIGILDLADASDFLMFAVRDLMVVFFASFPIVLFAAVFAWLARVAATPVEKRRGPARLLRAKPDVRGTAVVCVVAATVYVFYFLNRYSGVVAFRIRAGHGKACAYVISGDANAVPRSAQLVTTTTRFVVVYHPDDRTTQVIPVENLSRLVF